MRNKITFKRILKASASVLSLACLLSPHVVNAQIHVKTPLESAVGPYHFEPNVKTFDIKGELYISHVPSPKMNGMFYSGTYFEHKANLSGFAFNTLNAPIIKPQWNSHSFLGEQGREFAELHVTSAFTTGIFQFSDQKLKTNIKPIASSLTKLLQLKPFTYDFIHVNNNEMPKEWNDYQLQVKKNHAGFMAQEINMIYPQLVKHNSNSDMYYVNYIGLIPEIVRAMQEQQDLIHNLNTIITKHQSDEDENKEAANKDNPSTLQNMIQQTSQTTSTFGPIEPIMLPIKTNGEGAYQIRVYDLSGNQVFKSLEINSSSTQIELPRIQFSSGYFYYTLFKNNQEIYTHKLIILD